MRHRPPYRCLGHRVFVDGVERPVYEDSDRRQHVLDDDGIPVHGVWLIPEDEPDLPLIVLVDSAEAK